MIEIKTFDTQIDYTNQRTCVHYADSLTEKRIVLIIFRVQKGLNYFFLGIDL